MDYSKMKSSIDRAILKSPLDVAAYDDKFALCRDYEGTEFRLAHEWNQALQEEIRAGLKLAVDTRDFKTAEGFDNLLFRSLLFCAPHYFDAYLQAVEYGKPLDKKATSDSEVNKTRGLVNAITTNTLVMAKKPLGLWDIADMVKKIYGANAPTDGLVLWCDAVTLFQVNADAVQNGLTVVPAAREINGIALSSVVTPIGIVYLYLGECLPAGTALLLNLDVIAPVYQPVPGKGNFFLEPLAKTGAGEKYQLFGQIGLDHGPEWYHGKFTGISTTFEKPTCSRSVYVANAADIGKTTG